MGGTVACFRGPFHRELLAAAEKALRCMKATGSLQDLRRCLELEDLRLFDATAERRI